MEKKRIFSNLPKGGKANSGKLHCLKCVTAVALTGTLVLGTAGCGNRQSTGEDNSLTYWVRLHANIATSVTNFSETPFAKEYMKQTGINVTYIHPVQGQEKENLNLLIASGELPDIIETEWLSRDPESSIAKNTIIKLNDIIESDAPNLKKFLSENQVIDRSVKTDSGNYYVFPFVRSGEKLLSTAGFMMRDDWLNELGLEAPETIEEWEKVLTAFKERKGASCPFVGGINQLGQFTGGFGVGYDFYVDDGKVKYGCLQDGFGEFLATMNRWYRSGLIDRNFALMDNDFITTNILNGSGGSSFGAGGGQMGTWLNSAKNNGDTRYSLTAVKYPAVEKGMTPEFSNKQWSYSPLNGAAITGKCKNPKLAAKFLDYSYSEKGSMLNNFGIEGESYELVDGNPTYTELITNNPEKLPMSQILTMYVRSSNEGPFVQDERYIEQYYQLPAQKNALNIWSDNKYEEHAMPQVTLTKEELSEYNRIMTDFTTFRDENIVSFIIGSRPISEFDSFVQECKNKKVERAIEIQQAAYDRFMSR